MLGHLREVLDRLLGHLPDRLLMCLRMLGMEFLMFDCVYEFPLMLLLPALVMELLVDADDLIRGVRIPQPLHLIVYDMLIAFFHTILESINACWTWSQYFPETRWTK